VTGALPVLHLRKVKTSVTFSREIRETEIMLIDYDECVYSDAENCEVHFCAVCKEVE